MASDTAIREPPNQTQYRVLYAGDFVSSLPITEGLMKAAMMSGMKKYQAIWWIFRHSIEFDYDEDIIEAYRKERFMVGER